MTSANNNEGILE
ncbi:unnamed protein product, partial [Rotaria sp. Silwood1]